MKRIERIESRRFQREVASFLPEIEPLLQDLAGFLGRNGLTEALFKIQLTIRELLTNAMVHGNGLDPQKRVRLDVRVGSKWVHAWIVDEGQGFDWREKMRAPIPEPHASSGRGLAIARIYASKMAFNRPGNRVRLWIEKKKKGGPRSDAKLPDCA